MAHKHFVVTVKVSLLLAVQTLEWIMHC